MEKGKTSGKINSDDWVDTTESVADDWVDTSDRGLDISQFTDRAPGGVSIPGAKYDASAGLRMLDSFLEEMKGMGKATLYDIPKRLVTGEKGGMFGLVEELLGASAPHVEASRKAFNEGDPVTGTVRALAGVPLIGPLSWDIASALTDDPASGLGKLAANAVPEAIGMGAIRAGKNIPTKARPAQPQIIPGASQMRIEKEPAGFLSKIARAKSRGPSGAKLVEEKLLSRDVAVRDALKNALVDISPEAILPEALGAKIKSRARQVVSSEENRAPFVADIAKQRANLQANRMQTNFDLQQDARLAAERDMRASIEQEGVKTAKDIVSRPGGILATPEASGKAIRGALSERTQTNIPRKLEPTAGTPPSVADIESALWEPINAQMSEVVPDVSNIQVAAAEMSEKYRNANNVLADNLSAQTRKIIGKASELEATPTIPAEYSGLPLEAQTIILEQMQGMPSTQTPPKWGDLHIARQEIDDLIRKGKSGLVDTNTAALKKIRTEITNSMRAAISDQGLLRQFEQANAMTRYKHQAFGEGTVGKILKRGETAMAPSDIIDSLVKGTPEDARQFINAIGSDVIVGSEIKTAVRRNLFEKHTGTGSMGTGVVDYRSALHDLQTNPTYRELLRHKDYSSLANELSENIDRFDMPKKEPYIPYPKASSTVSLPGAKAETEISAGTHGPYIGSPKVTITRTQREADAFSLRKALASDSPEQILNKILGEYKASDMRDIASMLSKGERKQLQRSSLEKLLNDSIGEDMIVNGPKFAKNFRQHRNVLKAAGVNTGKLKEFDALSRELEKYTMSVEHSRGAQWGGLAETGIVTGGGASALTSALMGHPGTASLIAGMSAASLLGPRMLLKVMLEPNGPILYREFLRTGKITKELSRIIGAGSKTVPLAPKSKEEVKE